MRLHNIIVLGLAASLLASCSGTGRPGHVSQPSDSLYTAQAALSVYGYDPHRALTIIDSAEIVGNVTPFKAEFLRATVYAQSINDPQWSRALTLCDSLLQCPETTDDTKQSIINRCNVLRLMQGIYRGRNNNEQWLKCSIELAELNRQMGEEVEVLRMEADIAMVYVVIGREKDGIAMLDHAISSLGKGSPSVDRMDAWIVALKRKINLSFENNHYNTVVQLAQKILSKLDHYESHASEYAEDSFRLLPIPENRKNYCNFYRSQAYAFLARAYAKQGNLLDARSYAEKFEASDYAQTYSGHKQIASTWILLGEWDKFLAYTAEAEKQMGTDTLNSEYATILYGRGAFAKAEGRYREAYVWQNRYASLQETLDRELMKCRAQEYAGRYHEQEQQLALSKEQAERQRLKFLTFGLAAILLLTAVFVAILFRQMIAIRRKNAALSREITELIEVRENYMLSYSDETSNKIQQQQARLSDMSNEELFKFLRMAIISEHLFLNPLLDRQQLMERFHLSKDRIGAAFSQGSRYVSLKDFLNNIRLQYGAKMLIAHPEMTITDVASSSGFSSSSIFARNFKQRFALTPTEFREPKGRKTSLEGYENDNINNPNPEC